ASWAVTKPLPLPSMPVTPTRRLRPAGRSGRAARMDRTAGAMSGKGMARSPPLRKCQRCRQHTRRRRGTVEPYRGSESAEDQHMPTHSTSLLLAGLGLLAAAPAWAADADLILHHGKVVTVDRKFSIHEAIAVKDGRILRVGTDANVLQTRGPRTEVLDL